MMKKVMHWMFLSCWKATELMEKKLSFRLSPMENMQLKMHKAMCDACTRYETQSRLIDQAISSQESDTPTDGDINLLKEKINAKLGKPKN